MLLFPFHSFELMGSLISIHNVDLDFGFRFFLSFGLVSFALFYLLGDWISMI